MSSTLDRATHERIIALLELAARIAEARKAVGR